MLNVISAIKYCRLIFLAGCRYFENKPRRLKGIIYKQKTEYWISFLKEQWLLNSSHIKVLVIYLLFPTGLKKIRQGIKLNYCINIAAKNMYSSMSSLTLRVTLHEFSQLLNLHVQVQKLCLYPLTEIFKPKNSSRIHHLLRSQWFSKLPK